MTSSSAHLKSLHYLYASRHACHSAVFGSGGLALPRLNCSQSFQSCVWYGHFSVSMHQAGGCVEKAAPPPKDTGDEAFAFLNSWRLVRSTVAMLVSSAAAIRLPPSLARTVRLQMRASSATGRTLAFANQPLVDRVPPRRALRHISAGTLFPPQSPPSLPCRDRDSEIPVMINDGRD
jgi:hypothetical protein